MPIVTDELEVQIHYIRQEDASNFIARRTASEFISDNSKAKVTVPTNTLFELAQNLENWSEVTWMCI